MFARLGSLTYRFRYLIVAGWVLLAGGAVLLAPSLAGQGTTDQSSFLPSGTESVLARDALERAFPGATAASSASLVFTREAGLTDADRAYISTIAAWLTSADAPAVVRDAVTNVATADNRPELASMLRSEDGRLEMMAVNLDVTAAGNEAQGVISAIREHLSVGAPTGLDAHVTGTAAISTDYLDAIVKGTDSTTIVTVLLVVVILLLIYRAPLAALVPLITIGAAFLVSRGVLGLLAAAGWRLSSMLDTFVVVLVFGVGTDYAIFLISRFREEVSHGDWHRASQTTVRRIGAVISASAATVIVGLGSMAFADFGMIQSMGPALAVAIFVTLIAGLTLTPALLGIFGHYLFWPLHLRTREQSEAGGFFARLATSVSRRPGIVTVVLLVALLVPAVTIGRMQTNFDVLAELPSASDARIGFDQVAAHLGRGKVVQSTGVIDAGAGVDLLAPGSLARLQAVTKALIATDGIASVTSLTSPEGDGVVPDGFRPSVQLTEMADGFAGDSGAGAATDASALLDSKVDEGLTTATEYLALLGEAFPDVAAGAPFSDAQTDLASARDEIRSARDGSVVTTQLRELSTALTAPTAAGGGGSGTSVGIMGEYLDELVAAFPAVRDNAAFTNARAAAGRLEQKASIAAALDLSSSLSSLATWFETNRPDATLVPQSLAGTTDAKQRRTEIQATFRRLETELRALSATFAPRSDDIFVPLGLSGTAGQDVSDAVSAFMSDDRSATRFYLATSDDPYSQSAFGAVRAAQGVLAAAAPDFGASAAAYLGGPTAEFADIQSVLAGDFRQVGFITVIGILLVLVLLLRAVVAPLYLVGTVLLSCATALGLSAWFFQSVLGQAGVSFYLPLLVFVLLVALGSDYNIFLMSRVREESETRPIHEGIRVASGRTGAVITSAGLILAGTFGSMATAPLTVLVQVGLTVAVGVLIDTFVVRSILVPAIAMLVGDWSWWPFGPRGLGRISWPITVTMPSIAGSGAGVAAAPSSEAEAMAGRPLRWRRLAVAALLVALVPTIFAGLLTWSLSDPTAHLDRVTAAVVDEDEGATTTAADGTVTSLDLGADLVARLTTGIATDTFAWQSTDAADAADGLSAGRYAAVLTVPSDFSRTIAAIRTAKGTAVPKATLRLATSDASGAMVEPIARSLSDAIARSTAKGIIASYVDDVLLTSGGDRDRLAGASTEASQLASSTTDLADGAASTSTVAGELVSGLETMASGTSAAGSGAKALAKGVSELASGAAKLSSGASSLADGTSGIATGNRKLADGLKSMAAQTKGFGKQAQLLDGGANDLATGVTTYTGYVSGLSANCTALGGTAALCGQLAAIADQGPGLAAGASTLASRTSLLAASAPQLEAGIATAAKGARKLATGSSAVATGAKALAAGAKSAASGATKLAAGTASASSGVSKLAAGVRDAVDGARLVQAETDGLATDGRSVAADAQTLADGLERDAGAAMTTTQAERRAVGEVVADPIVVESRSIDGAGSTGVGLAPSFMALALWVGALATFLVLPALPAGMRRAGRRSGALVWLLVAAGLGIVQVVLMVAALRWAVGIEVARLPELGILAVLAMVAAVAVVQALVALFGTRGWFVALLILVLQAAASGAWYPIETAPGFFQALHPLLPMTYAIEAFRTLIAGGDATIVPAAVVLVLWTVGAFAVTLLATRLRTSDSGASPEPVPVGGGAG